MNIGIGGAGYDVCHDGRYANQVFVLLCALLKHLYLI